MINDMLVSFYTWVYAQKFSKEAEAEHAYLILNAPKKEYLEKKQGHPMSWQEFKDREHARAKESKDKIGALMKTILGFFGRMGTQQPVQRGSSENKDTNKKTDMDAGFRRMQEYDNNVMKTLLR